MNLRERLEAHAGACRDAMAKGELRPALPEDVRAELLALRRSGARADLAGANLARAYLAGAYLAGPKERVILRDNGGSIKPAAPQDAPSPVVSDAEIEAAVDALVRLAETRVSDQHSSDEINEAIKMFPKARAALLSAIARKVTAAKEDAFAVARGAACPDDQPCVRFGNIEAALVEAGRANGSIVERIRDLASERAADAKVRAELERFADSLKANAVYTGPVKDALASILRGDARASEWGPTVSCPPNTIGLTIVRGPVSIHRVVVGDDIIADFYGEEAGQRAADYVRMRQAAVERDVVVEAARKLANLVRELADYREDMDGADVNEIAAWDETADVLDELDRALASLGDESGGAGAKS
ncbi:MAG: hypothetical protein WBL29_17645 [Burkholderiales bacterium]